MKEIIIADTIKKCINHYKNDKNIKISVKLSDGRIVSDSSEITETRLMDGFTLSFSVGNSHKLSFVVNYVKTIFYVFLTTPGDYDEELFFDGYEFTDLVRKVFSLEIFSTILTAALKELKNEIKGIKKQKDSNPENGFSQGETSSFF